jgi:hypothetical protein
VVALEARSVLALDAHGGVDAEPTGALPGEHVVGVDLVEEATASEVSQDAALRGGVEALDVLGAQLDGLVEADLAIAERGEHAVEHDEVVVGVDVEGGAEPTEDADASELRPAGRSGARASERGLDHPQKDPEHGAGDAHVVVQVRT